jgi:hypothetical protein
MSAFVVSREHVAALVRFERDHTRDFFREWDGKTLAEVADTLLAENLWSVAYRYESGEAFETPFTDREVMSAPKIDGVQALKAVHCLAYQSCEHPEYETSTAAAYLARIKRTVEHNLPGYEQAAWSISA